MRALLVSILFVGCTVPDDLRFTYEGSDEGYAAASAAVAEWQTCGATLTLARDLPDAVPLREVPFIEPLPGKVAFAATTVRGDRVVLIRFVKRPGMQTSLAHELGHALGLGHHAGGIMARHDGREAEHVTEVDCAALRACGGRDCRDEEDEG